MRVNTEALPFARDAGLDAAKRRMRKAGRTAMSDSDYDHAIHVTEKMLLDLGFDTRSWIAMAGVPRNESRKRPESRVGVQTQRLFTQLRFCLKHCTPVRTDLRCLHRVKNRRCDTNKKGGSKAAFFSSDMSANP